MTTRVVHWRREACDVRIDRPSIWGNPFRIGPDGTRHQVIQKYRAWILTQPHLLARLPELRGKVLGCWCAPQACHGDVLAELADTYRTGPTMQMYNAALGCYETVLKSDLCG
jgi:hypothetical protein